MFPRRILALLAAFAVSLLALADGVYLSMVHIDLELGGGGIGQICHELSETGCAVTGGRFGAIAGLPVSVIGAAGAITGMVLALVALIRVRKPVDAVRDLLLWLAAASVFASVVMAILSLVEGKYCPFCVVWYGLNAGLAIAAWFSCTSRGAPEYGVPARGITEALRAGLRAMARPVALLPALVFALSLAGLGSLYEAFHERLVHAEARNAELLIEDLLSKPPHRDVELAVRGAELPRRVVGPPGSAAAPITVIEFSDFQCPFCKRAWQQLKDYADVAPVPLELVHVHFPLDPSCNPLVGRALHPDACLAAKASECARRRDRFWDYASALFADQEHLGRAALLDRAEALGLDRVAFDDCLEDPSVELQLLENISLAGKARVQGTPTLYIGGYRVGGVPRRPTFDRILAEIGAARERGANGDAPKDLSQKQPEEQPGE